MDLLYSTIVLLILSIIWAVIIFLVFRRMIGKQTKKDKIMLFGGFLIFVGLAAIVIAGTITFEYIESPKFCGTSCHVMEPFYNSFKFPGNNQMMDIHLNEKISCSNCHNNPGIVGTIEGFLSAIPEAYIYFTNTYDINDLHGDISREACLKCHEEGIAKLPGEINALDDIVVNPHDDETKCDACHDPHENGFGLTQYACPICHGIYLDNFEIRLLNHSERVKLNCADCHNRKHPDNAKIFFSEYPSLINTDFCSDCHVEEIESLNRGVHKSISCIICHNEHKSLSINFDKCNEPCHNPPSDHNKFTSNCIICHDTTRIHSISTSSVEHDVTFSDIVCSTCHKLENSAYEYSFTPSSLEIYGDNGCIDCHPNHNTTFYPHIIISPFNNCSSCHPTYNTSVTIHDRTATKYLGFLNITSDFCSDCHESEVKKFNLGIHYEYECIDCHEEHLIVKINFDSCNNPICHITPSYHNNYLRNCLDPICHTDISSIH